jgi:hypothetical protein
MKFLRSSEYRWDCEKCGVAFEAGKGGVCPSCRQTLCDLHLFGSRMNKLKASLGQPVKCVQCRAAEMRTV